MKKLIWFLLCLILFGCSQNDSNLWSKVQELEQRGQHDKALEVARKALDASLNNLRVEARANLSTAMIDPVWLAEDILKITEAINQKENAEFYVLRGFLYSVIGEHDMAIKDYNRGIELDENIRIMGLELPSQKNTLYFKALSLWQAGRIDEAVAGLDAVIAANPDFQGAYYYRGVIKSKLGDQSGAIADINKANSMTGRLPAQEMLNEMTGRNQSNEILSGTFIFTFFANQPPFNRPYGYIWMIGQ